MGAVGFNPNIINKELIYAGNASANGSVRGTDPKSVDINPAANENFFATGKVDGYTGAPSIGTKVDVFTAVNNVNQRGQGLTQYYDGKQDITSFSGKWGERQSNGLTMDVGERYINGGVSRELAIA